MPAFLQKPSFKSKSKDHRFVWLDACSYWKKATSVRYFGNAELYPVNLKLSSGHLSKTFANLMFRGKRNAALRFLDEQSPGGVLPLSDAVNQDLPKKHPSAKPGDQFSHDRRWNTFRWSTEQRLPTLMKPSYRKAAIKPHGSAGPSGIDECTWHSCFSELWWCRKRSTFLVCVEGWESLQHKTFSFKLTMQSATS